jgi:surface protein
MLILNKNILTIGGNRLEGGPFTPPEPPGPALPPYTIRLKYTEGVTPTFTYGGTGVQVSSSPNIWDLTYENANWYRLLRDQSDLLEIIDANTTNVTGMEQMILNCSLLTTVPLFDTSSVSTMKQMFYGCSNLTSVPLFNTSIVTDMTAMFRNCTSLTTVPLFDTSSVSILGTMFYGCSNLTSIPLFDTSSATNMTWMFYNCTNVQSGALSLYQQASSQTNPPTNHNQTFRNCGSNTTTGAAELAQIPDDWK